MQEPERYRMEIIFALIGGLTAYFNYRNAKADGSLARENEARQARKIAAQNYVPKPLPPNATWLDRAAHWLGLEDDETKP